MRIRVNNTDLTSHTRETDPPALRVWRAADDLIKRGELDAAATLIKANVGEDDDLPKSTLVIRVMLKLGARLDRE